MKEVFDIEVETNVNAFVGWLQSVTGDLFHDELVPISESDDKFFRLYRHNFRRGASNIPTFVIHGYISTEPNPKGYRGFGWRGLLRPIQIGLIDLGNGWIIAKGKCTEHIGLENILNHFEEKIQETFRKHADKRKRGPTVDTQALFDVFSRLKIENPNWTQNKVAIEASEILNQDVNADKVRNTYRTMGIKWPKGNRTR